MPDTRTKAIIVLVTVGILGGIAPLFMKYALLEFGPLEIVFTRFLTAFLILLPVALLKKEASLRTKHMPIIIFNSLLFTGNIIFFILGLPFTTSISSQLLYLLTPTLVLVLSFFILKMKIENKHLLSIAAGFAGGALLIARGNMANLAASLGTPKGNAIILIAVCSWSGYIVFSKKISSAYSPLTLLLYNSFTASLISGLFILKDKINIIRSFANASLSGLIWIAALIFLNSILFFFLYQWMIKQVKPFTASMSTYIGLLATSVAATALLGERLSTPLIASTLLITISSYLAFRKK